MELLFTEFSTRLFQALCWTIVHSLWQGIVAAIVAGLVILCTRKSRAVYRYQLLLAVLCCFLLTSSITFYKECASSNSISKNAAATIHYQSISSKATLELKQSATGIKQNLSTGFSDYLDQHAWAIVLLWFFFFVIKCIQLFSGLRYIYRIRHFANEPVSTQWKQRLLQLSEKMGLHRSIIFLESQLVKVPVVVGWLKPVILVPAGLLANLPAEQVEAILLHELAHIRRSDFLVNFLQSLAEVLFFFNPAIIWISNCIREEREACCDDAVLACLPAKGNYLEALVSFQEFASTASPLALGIGGNKNYLLNRVRRMLTQENKKLNIMEKIILATGLAALMAFGILPGEKQKQESSIVKYEVLLPKLKPVAKNMAEGKISLVNREKLYADTVPRVNKSVPAAKSFPSISSNSDNGKTVIEATDETGKKYVIKKQNDQVTSLSINGTDVPQGQIGKYKELIGSIQDQQEIRMKRSAEEMQQMRAMQSEQRRQMEREREDMRREHEQQQKELLSQHQMKEREMQEDRQRQLSEMQELKKQQMDLEQSIMQKSREQMQQMRDSMRSMEQMQRKLVRDYTKTETNDEVDQIISDLLQNQLIKNTDPLSFQLSDQELTVNGKKQPSNIHQIFKDRYIHNKSDLFNYSRKGGSKSVTINRNR
ncbi:MAG: M56 family metallopeptidase [Flavisolibacter sp.]